MEVLPTGDLKLTAMPQAIEVEKDVLGVFLNEKDSFASFVDRLFEDYFHDVRNQVVFKAIFSLFKEGNGVDLITVANEVKKFKNEDITPFYLTALQCGIGSSAHLAEWVAVLHEKYVLRQILKISHKAYYSALDPQIDVFDLLSEAEKNVTDLINGSMAIKEHNFAESFDEVIENMKLAYENKGVIGVQTGDNFIDKNLMGLVAPDVTIIAARPKAGKSTLALNIALNLAKHGEHVGFFSYEMRDMQLIWKIISNYIGSTVNEIRSGDLSQNKWNALGDKYSEIKGLPFHLSSQFLNVFQMKAKIKSWIAKFGIKAIFIDYLQLIPAIPEYRRQNREMQVSFNSREIKSIAMECNIPIILLSQLSREGAKGEPELHHLRESGAIEQDADNVMFLYNNEETTLQHFPGWVEGDPEWTVDFMIKACRLGPNGRRTRILNAAHNKFREVGYDYDYVDYSQPREKPF